MSSVLVQSVPRVLVVEDGFEYITNLERFLSEDFELVRAGDGPEALERIAEDSFDVLFLDMRFDRADRLFGEDADLLRRYAGDAARARRFLEDNQGTYILAALRAQGCRLPALMSYDFDGEPRRFQNLLRLHGPVAYLSDTAGPAQIRAALVDLCR